jgi:predicted aldo/keto reductase-like oxidoreductase
VIVATKSFYKNIEQLDEDFNTSLTNLQRGYIDLYQFHIVNHEEELEAILKKGGPLDYLKAEQRKGRLRHIGITSHRPSLMLKALESGAFETVQVPFNFIGNEPLDKAVSPGPQAGYRHHHHETFGRRGFQQPTGRAIAWILQHS